VFIINKISSTTVKAMATFVEALDKRRVGALLLVLVILAVGTSAAIARIGLR
jgi:hypothetical protein